MRNPSSHSRIVDMRAVATPGLPRLAELVVCCATNAIGKVSSGTGTDGSVCEEYNTQTDDGIQ